MEPKKDLKTWFAEQEARQHSYYKQHTYPFAESLVSDYAKMNRNGEYCLDLDDLPECELAKFAMHVFKQHDNELDFICNDLFTSKIAQIMEENNSTTQADLAKTIRTQMIASCSDTMQEILSDALHESEMSYHNEMGSTLYRHADNGEYYWRGRNY